MSTQNDKLIVHEAKADYLDKAFLIYRDGDFPLYIKPVRARVPATCVLTGREISPGQYTYPCYSNPPRLSPYGNEKCHINAALKRGNAILPQGYFAARLPTSDDLRKRGAKIEGRRNKYLEQTTVKLLANGKGFK